MPPRPASVEPLESRQLLAAQLGFYRAPASIANGTLTATVTTGTAPLLTAGSYTLAPTALPTAAVGATGITQSDAYSYSRTGRRTAVLRFTDVATGITYADQLTFSTTTDTTGTFALAPSTPGVTAGTQTGTFTFAPAVQPVGADAIATILHTTAAVVSGNNAGVAVANIANVGNANAIGYVGATFYLSPDGLLADATPLGSNGKFLFLRPQQSFNAIVHFNYPNLPTGTYYLLASLTPSLQFVDTDRGNDFATSPTPIQLNQRSYDLSVPAVAVSGFHAGQTLTAGAKQNATVAIQNSAATVAGGLVRLDISAVGEDGTQTPVSPQGIPVRLDLDPHQRLVLPESFTVPALGEPVSGFVATVDTSGLTTVPQPYVNLQTDLISAAPISTQVPNAIAGALNGNHLARVMLNVTDTGDVSLFGRVEIHLLATTDAAGDNPTVLTSVEKNLYLPEGAHAQFPVDFTVPPGLATGDYYVTAQVGPSATTYTVPTYTTRLQIPAGNVAATGPVLIVKPPVPTIAAAVQPLADSTVVAGQNQSVSVVLTNTGTGAANGQYLIQLEAAPVGNANAVGRLPLIVAKTEPIHLAPGAQQTVTLSVRLSRSLLRYASQFYLVANIDAAGITHETVLHVQDVSSQLLTLVLS